MTATVNRRAVNRHGLEVLPSRGVARLAAGAAVKAGWHLSNGATGFSQSFVTGLSLTSNGIALEDADNTSGADGDLEVDVAYGIVDQLIGTAGDALVAADAPCVCYAMDNQTVGKTSGSGTRSLGGVFVGINSETSQARVIVGPVGWLLADAMLLASAAEPAATITTGTATLAAGTVTVATTAVGASSKIFVSRKSKAASTAIGVLATPTRINATSFVIVAQKTADGTTETNDISTVDWAVIG